MWYKQARPFVESGQLAILGVIQEQHADRARLYKQWKQFDFPIIQDATTQLDLAAVPIPLLIDEHGVVRNNRPRPNDLKAFIESTFDAPASETAEAVPTGSQIDKLISKANTVLHTRDTPRLQSAIDSFKKAVSIEPKNGKAMFGLGVAYRTRFDSALRKQDDFNLASEYWSKALATNPNQYIWRRRIEQYGPRQIKPYPFYDWVEEANKTITDRGEQPVKIVAALTGAELAKPSKNFKTTQPAENPDPDAKIFADEDQRVSIQATTVPAEVDAGKNVRVHLNFELKKGKWNNEAEPLKVWINESSNGEPESQLLIHEADLQASSKCLDFEYATDQNTKDCEISGYALYHTCDKDGVCYYFRQDFTIPVKTR